FRRAEPQLLLPCQALLAKLVPAAAVTLGVSSHVLIPRMQGKMRRLIRYVQQTRRAAAAHAREKINRLVGQRIGRKVLALPVSPLRLALRQTDHHLWI